MTPPGGFYKNGTFSAVSNRPRRICGASEGIGPLYSVFIGCNRMFFCSHPLFFKKTEHVPSLIVLPLILITGLADCGCLHLQTAILKSF